MTISRRDMLKSQAAAIAATVANISIPALAQPVAGGIGSLEIEWSKAPCRFCGTGCGVMVGVKEGKVVATHGDNLAEVTVTDPPPGRYEFYCSVSGHREAGMVGTLVVSP